MRLKAILDLPIKQRFMLGMSLMLLPIIILAVTAAYSLNRSTEALEHVIEETHDEILPVLQLQKTLLRAAMPANDYIIDGRHDNYERFKNIEEEVRDGFELVSRAPFNDRKETERIAKAREEWMRAKALSEEIFSLPDVINSPRAKEDMVRLDLTIERAVEMLGGAIAPAYIEMERELREAHETKWKVQFVILVVFAIGLLVAVATGLTLSLSVIYPVKALKHGADELREGHLSYRIAIKTKDELGQLAGSFNLMAEKIENSTAMLQELATRDGLTGLFNAREFFKRLKDEFNRYKRFERNFSLIILDIDHFKKVNDTYGHQAGDRVLAMVAKMTAMCVRETDFTARYGGEEFAVILPDTESAGAMILAERINRLISKTPIDIGNGHMATVTVSAGVAVTSAKTSTDRDVLSLADHALYSAKESGRDRCVLA